MKQVTAYEHNGKIYKTAEEALKKEMYEALLELFADKNWQQMLETIVNSKETQDKLSEIIDVHQFNMGFYE